MFPVDSLKTRSQLAVTTRLTGASYFAGLSASLIGQIPYAALTFSTYEAVKSRISGMNRLATISMAAVAGDLSGALWLVPSEVIKQRLQAGQYSSASQAMKGIYRSDGVRGFYRGMVGQMARDVPFRVIQLLSYEYMKRRLQQQQFEQTHTKQPFTKQQALCAGALSGSVSAFLTTPLVVVKTRLMTSTSSQGAVRTAISLVRDEGASSLFKGASARVALIAPSVSIFFLVYEAIQNY